MSARALLVPALVLLVAAGCTQEYDVGLDHPGNDTPGDDTDNPNLDGPQPDIKLDPEVMSFGYLLPDCPSDLKTVTVSNVGDADLEIYDINGPGASQFGSDHPTSSYPVLAPGESFTFQVDFEASSLGDFTGYIEFESNDPDENVTGVDLEGHGSDTPMNEDLFEQPIPDGVDVLWVLDNSCSMGDITNKLSNELDSFVGNFTTLGLDYQLAVTTTDMYSDGHKGLLQGAGVMSPAIQGSDAAVVSAFGDAVDDAFNTGGAGTERGMDGAYSALTAPLINNENAGLVRTDAHLSIIVISDEEDQSEESGGVDDVTFINWLDAYKGDPDKTSYSAMAGAPQSSPSGFGFPNLSCAFSGGGTAEGTYYYPHVANATGGLYTELCDMDFNTVLTWLSFYAAGMQTKFCLSANPTPITSLGVTVDGNSVSRISGPPPWSSGWNLDANNCIEFYGSSIPGPGTDVRITYQAPSTCN